MTDILVIAGIVIVSIVLFIGIIMFTVYLILNEKKLKDTMSIQMLKKIYSNAIYLSLFIVIIGIITYLIGTSIKATEVVYFGWAIFSAGVIATLYSSIGLYNAVHKKSESIEKK